MDKIVIAGLGPGSKDYILPITIKKIKNAQILIGGQRNLESISDISKDIFKMEIDGKLDYLVDYIRENRGKKIVMIVSGDTGFYSMLKFMNRFFNDDDLEVIPGISSMQYLFSKIARPWQDAKLGSLHHKEFDYIKALKKYNRVGLLTDNVNTPQMIAKNLMDNGLDYTLIIGENLSYDNEKIGYFKASKLINIDDKFSMNVVIIEKDGDNNAF